MRGHVARFLGIALIASSASIAMPASYAGATERFEDGLAAYQRNDYEKSLKTLRPLAEKGDARAQYLLGRQYQFGQGTKADRAEAYHWYRRAEAKGHVEAKLFRQLLEKRWNISAADKARGERKLAEANAPPKTVQSEPKPKPDKPQTTTASAPERETPKPSVASKPSERVKPEIKPAVETARAKLNEKPANVAAKPPATEDSPTTVRSRLEAARPTQPPARDDDDDTHPQTATTSMPPARSAPPAETRTAMAPPTSPGYTAPQDYPRDYAPPTYTPPTYASPTYAPPAYTPPTYTDSAPPYYAPAVPPAWGPAPYYGARPYYQPVWGNQPFRGYVNPGWRGAGWQGNPGYRYRRW